MMEPFFTAEHCFPTIAGSAIQALWQRRFRARWQPPTAQP
jgi:hypothetical protein